MSGARGYAPNIKTSDISPHITHLGTGELVKGIEGKKMTKRRWAWKSRF